MIPHTDDSNFAGGGVMGKGFFQVIWGKQADLMTADKQLIDVRELYAVVTAALNFEKQWKEQRTLLY
jgi:hypothetical protein